MCTLTWRAVREGGYDLFFNRDEINTRGIELPLRKDRSEGITFAAPRDSDRGGTWLLANAYGLTVALLNDYASRWRPPANAAGLSRGNLVLACASAATPEAAVTMVKGMDLGRTGAFKLVIIGADGRARRLGWNGVEVAESASEITGEGGGDGGFLFETSSSFDTAAVCASRRLAYEALLAGRAQAEGDELEAFHWKHDRANGAASVLMRRPDARTRSVTRVGVSAGRVEVQYQPVSENARPVDGGGVSIKFSRL